MESNGNVPILGAASENVRVGTGYHALVRKLDENGTFKPAKVVQQGNGVVGIPHRSDYVDAEELVEMLRIMVREEIQAALLDKH